MARLKPVLRLGPWLWPDEGTPEFETACRASELGAPPPVAGRFPVVTVRHEGRHGTLWCLDLDGKPGDISLGARSTLAWRQALAALPRSLPVLLASLRPHQAPPAVASPPLGYSIGDLRTQEATVEGTSLGLACFLALTARVSGLPLLADAVASATIDEFGRLGPVAGLQSKVDTVVECAPRIRRFLVCAEQKDEALACAGGRIEVLAFASAAEAAEALYNQALIGKLVDCPAGERRRMTDTLLRLVLSERGLLCWSPVRDAARKALDTWGFPKDERSHQRHVLEFVEAVADRHETNGGVLTIPPPEWLATLPRPTRLHIIANVVQHAADTGTPPPDQVIALATAAVANEPRESFAPELRVQGALGRLRAFMGDAEGALRIQQQLAMAHFDALNYEEVSRPLCEWLRLAATLGERESFARAVDLRSQLDAVGPLTPNDIAYLRLAVARGRCELGPPSREILDELTALSLSPDVRDHVLRSAGRWRLRAARQLDASSDAVAEARADFDRACPEGDPGRDARVFRALVRLDDALEAHAGAEARAALEALREATPGLILNLTSSVSAEDQAAHVARFYPY